MILNKLYRRILKCISDISRRRGKESLVLLLVALDRTFKTKLEKGKIFEILVKNCMIDYGYEVDNVPLEYQHKGDLYLTDTLTGESFYLEVKRDTYIAATHNMYIELTIDRKGKLYDGWYHYDYSKIAVVDASPKSQNTQDHKSIYIIDWQRMKEELNLNDSRCRQISHSVDENRNTALLVPLRYIIARGWLLDEYYYNADDWKQAYSKYKELQQIGA